MAQRCLRPQDGAGDVRPFPERGYLLLQDLLEAAELAELRGLVSAPSSSDGGNPTIPANPAGLRRIIDRLAVHAGSRPLPSVSARSSRKGCGQQALHYDVGAGGERGPAPRAPALRALAFDDRAIDTVTVVRSLLVLGLLAACSRPAARHHADAAAPIASAVRDAMPTAEAAPPERELLGGASQVDLLAPDGAGLGVLSVPVGAREARPVVVALHGGSDHPEWACAAWSGITEGHAFVVCPRGTGAEAALAWGALADTKARIARAVAAARAAYPRWMLDADALLVGFSMGATQAANLAAEAPTTYRRVALAESAYAPEPIARFMPPWTRGGGERVVFLCTTPGCGPVYRRAAQEVARHGVPARLNLAGTAAHGMWPEVIMSMRRDLPWLVEGMPGWTAWNPSTAPGQGRTERFNPP